MQPNNFASYIATSGIDDEIRIWAPMSEADAFTLETDPTFMVEICDVSEYFNLKGVIIFGWCYSMV